jgi:hypothetical protein
MKITLRRSLYGGLFTLLCLLSFDSLNAQTEIDGIMMSKNNFCGGLVYSYSKWDNYWEGTMKRENLNLGDVSTKMVALMGNYGISDKLNVLFSIPYVKTKASAGTLHGLDGIQDLSLWLKYMPVETKVGAGTLSVYTIGGFSFPTTNYVADFLPLSIGMRSKNLSLRGMVDYQLGDWFATGSYTYVVRSNINIDRNTYYTNQLHNTNEVSMPNADQLNFRIGYRTERMIIEAIGNKMTTLGGFDITRNNIPFPSNRMNATNAGFNLKYNFKAVDGLSLVGGGNYTLKGRNVGQATAYNAGVFYILNFARHAKASVESTPKTN